ncbi:MAG TPA: hemerythrin domain-containing protein [Pyrinomonadaceae bacterium]|nr:hemerythrin domain-containing protein [Pyrinomonadaceae bacterium]
MFGGGGDNAIDVLKADHRKVEDLFAQVKANEDGNNKATFKKIKQELDVHAHIEEQVFYPHLLSEGDKELQKIVREGLEEHGQVKTLLTELDGMSGDSATFKAKLTVLMENVEHHVEEEEGEMFDMAADQIPEDTLERLGNLLEAERARVMTKGRSRQTRPRASAARQR